MRKSRTKKPDKKMEAHRRPIMSPPPAHAIPAPVATPQPPKPPVVPPVVPQPPPPPAQPAPAKPRPWAEKPALVPGEDGEE